MSPAAAQSFGSRWARDNLARAGVAHELRALDQLLINCGGDEVEASARARRYYAARGPAPHGLKVWTGCRPDDEDILSSCQDTYIIPLRTRTVAGRKVTLIRLPAPGAPDRPLNIEALLARWLMILDIRVREEVGSKRVEDTEPAQEVLVVDVGDMKPVHIKQHFRGARWRDLHCIRSAHPKKFSEVHIINTHRLGGLSLLMLHAGFRWRCRNVRVHARVDHIGRVLGTDCVPIEALPYEYGGKEGALKDLNDEWTKKLLSNANWLEEEAQRFLETRLKDVPARPRRRSEVRIPAISGGGHGSYPVLRRSCSERHLRDRMDEGTHGNYRTLKTSDHGFYA